MEELRRLNLAWIERTNPLRGLSISRATSMFDSARVWGSPRLQYAYNEIEATDPVLMTCVERRQSALAGLDYRFVAASSADETLANEQRDALDKFANGIENFSEALEHLDLGFFRGFSHVQPIWEGDAVSHINLLDSWNFLRNDAGEWLWNPRCHETTGGLEPIGPDARLVSLIRRRAIDYPAMIIYIRHALGDRDWGRFIERYAIPPVHFEMAPGSDDKDKPTYREAGDAAHNGQNTVRPSGSHIDFAAEARGADPFTPFIEHQDKYIVLLATGGTLTSLAQADTGSLAGGAQMEVWREIVSRDGVEIANALNRSLFRKYLETKFPGQPVCARFELSNETKPTADEIADLAGKLKTAGYTVDQAELEEAVGLKLVKDETPTPQPGFGAPFMNKQPVSRPDTRPSEGEQPSAILTAFAKDMSPAGKAVAELLQDPSKEAAEALLAKLDTLLPEDPAMTAVIAEEMAKAFNVTTAHRFAAASPADNSPSDADKEELANKDDANGMSHSESDGKFDGGNGGTGGKADEPEDDTHTPVEKKRIADYEASTDQYVVSFYQEMQRIDDPEKLSKAKCKIGTAAPKLTDRVKELTGLDTAGWTIELRGERAKHIDIRHGSNGKHDKSLANANDIGRINYVLQNFDSIDYCRDQKGNKVLSGQYQGKNGPSPVLEARMRIDGTYAIQEAIPDSKWKKIYIVSARIEKAKEP